ncbi:hypothetical protein SISSUDRAFT_1048352 [Sistotremastrum suecicum HHB10207 ss-3]|uniref:Thioesterase domain-containing protein n=1 Tax=Sistotremastrum suecicum HHB10207 ss-3 TaxID=1314776 RepID=A0A166CIS8_9AGAM|nr:hypothetical protein SISSUDRAFT_1048352 [Sistotremastrum suecicum HHB10207 ss-3]
MSERTNGPAWLSALPEQADFSHIGGNASADIKQQVANVHKELMDLRSGFGENIAHRFDIKSIDIARHHEGSRKMKATVYCEVKVEKDMVNKLGDLHGACASYLVGKISSFPIVALNRAQGSLRDFGVSHSITTAFHGRAKLRVALGTTLRIESTSLSVGNRALSARLEAWDLKADKLVFSGTHFKMFAAKL